MQFAAAIVAGMGNLRKNSLCLIGAIMFIVSALILSTAIILYVCNVNDEVTHRKKPIFIGESVFLHQYGRGFFLIVASVISCQTAAATNIYLSERWYQHDYRRFFKAVPGLRRKLPIKLSRSLSYRPRGSRSSVLVSS